MADKPRTPRYLGPAGRKLWQDVAWEYELRGDELLLLDKACRTADESARLDDAVRTEPLLVAGAVGQTRQNPLFNEARQTRTVLAALLKQLAVPAFDDVIAAKDRTNSQRAMDASRARWNQGRPRA